MSIVTRILALIAFTLLLIAGGELFNGARLRGQRLDEMRSDTVQLARIADLDMARILDGTRQLLGTLAKLPATTGWDQRACSVVEATASSDFEYDHLVAVDRRGIIQCSSSGAARVGASMPDRELLDRIVATGGFSVGSYGIGQLSRNEVIRVGSPVVDDAGTVIGAVYAGINVTWLNTAIDHWQLGENATIVVTDRNGVLIARHPDPRGVGRPLPDTLKTFLTAADLGVVEAAGADGAVRLFGYVPVRAGASGGLAVFVGRDRESVFADIDRSIWLNVVVVLTALLLSAVVAIIYVRRFLARPFQSLLTVAGRWRDGDWSARAGATSGIPEFDRLALAFDGMAAEVSSRDQSLQRRDAIMTAITKCAGELVTAGMLADAIPRILRTMGEAVDADRILVFEVQPTGLPARLCYAWHGPAATVEVGSDYFASSPGVVPPEIAEWLKPHREDGIVAITRGDVRGAARELFDAFKIESNLQAPILVDEALFGRIAVDDCRAERSWTPTEIDAVSVLANLIGAAIARERHLERLSNADAVVRNSPAIVYRLAVNVSPPHLTYISDNVSLLGANAAELVARPGLYLSLIHPDDRDAVKASLAAVARDVDAVGSLEFRIGDAGGTYRWVENRYKPSRDAAGRLEQVAGVLIDVTERKAAEEKLQFANTLLLTLKETSPEAILVVDPAERIISFNRHFVEMWRLPPDLVEGTDDAAVLAAVASTVKDPERFAARVHHLYAHPEEAALDEVETADGRFLDRHTAGLRTSDGHYLGRVWFFRDVTERKQAAQRLRQERDFTAAVIDSLPGLFVLVDEGEHVVRWNENLSVMTGIAGEKLQGLDALAIVDECDRDLAREKLSEAFTRGMASVELRVPEKAGDARTIDFSGRVITSDGHRYLIAVGTDITAARLAEKRLRASEERFRAVSGAAQDAIVMIDRDGKIVFWNQAAERTFGYTSEEAIGKGIHEWLAPRRFRDKANAGMADFAITGRGSILGKTIELAAIRKDGVEIPIELSAASMLLGTDWHAVAILRDITDRKRIEARMAQMAHYDILTGLANRGVFVDALQHAIARAHRGGKSFAVLYLDLDHFKDVNDTLGHPIGDLLLQSVAERLQASVRETDTVARFGGDEFAIIETDIDEPATAAVLADKVLDVIGRPFSIRGNEIRTGASVGIAVYGPESASAETLLSNADVALYRAKSEGRGTYRFFTDAMDAEVRTRVTLGAELRKAIASEELFLLYQPQVDVDTGLIAGVEALVRWRHPTRGVVSPDEFIPAAEKGGLIVALGHWVMREACRQMKRWLDAGAAPPLIAVNLSALQFKTPLELEKGIEAILAETGVPPRKVELELTESVLMDAARERNDVLLRLRGAGLRIAIDDFGTGYSSLDYLRRFPVDRIKIAQQFMSGLMEASDNAEIVKAAIGLARALKIDVVVEGVETAKQLELVKSWGGRCVQGYYFSMPILAAKIPALIRKGAIVPVPHAIIVEAAIG